MDYLLPLTPIPNQKRFDAARFIAFRQGTFDPLNCYLIQAIMTLPIAGVYTVIDTAGRPDTICSDIFNGDTQYWWLLLIYNDLWDFGSPPYPNIPVGTQIRYFSIADLERMYFTLKSAQLLEGTSVSS